MQFIWCYEQREATYHNDYDIKWFYLNLSDKTITHLIWGWDLDTDFYVIKFIVDYIRGLSKVRDKKLMP